MNKLMNTRSHLTISTAIIALCLLSASFAWAIGGQFGLQFAIDAPWRIEPYEQDGKLAYGPIPINIAFHDAVFDERRTAAARAVVNRIRVGKLVRVEVVERLQGGPVPGRAGALTTVLPKQLRDIQRKRQISTKRHEPPMEVCEPSSGSDCSGFLDITLTHEWHTMFYYQPRFPMAPGRNVQLEVTVVTRRDGDERRFRNDLVIHLGEAPLPRFTTRWLYGDLHYHSQMTDNEGESAYTYRNTVRGLAAIGMDYVFATDHASSSEQADGQFGVYNCGPLPGARCRTVDRRNNCPSERPLQLCTGVEARDLNPPRFSRALLEIRNANVAIRADALRGYLPAFTGRRVLPQIYMGEEVDAWPQMSNRDFSRGYIAYGDGLRYPWPDSLGCVQNEGLEKCKERYARQPGGPNTAVMVMDDQGVSLKKVLDAVGIDSPINDNERFPARQHVVYMPTGIGDPRKGFIPSNTGPTGGGSRPLPEVVKSIEKGGVAFLAHPMISSKPGNAFGPDIIPYSSVSLDVAWASPAILGLQLWNENDRVLSSLDRVKVRKVVQADNSGDKSFKYLLPWRDGTLLSAAPKKWQKREISNRRIELLRHGTHVWDRYLRKGLDPAQVSRLPWAAKGYPRRWFMAGGSDAHGDFNYRRKGRPSHSKLDGRCEEFWCDFPVSDTAIGKPRNLTFVHRASNRYEIGANVSANVHSNLDLIGALERGAFTVTDGPALRVVIDRDRDEKIDDDDFQMGSVVKVFPGDHIPLLVEWISTPEFGPVERVDLYVGNKDVVYAPKTHGPLGRPGSADIAISGYAADPSGGHLQFQIPASMGMHGQAMVYLAPKQFNINGANKFFYIRAFAQTDTSGCPSPLIGGISCGERFAFTNPVWGDYSPNCTDSSRSIDADGNKKPDVCEVRIKDDPCLSPVEERTHRRPSTTTNERAPTAAGRPGQSGGSPGDFTSASPHANVMIMKRAGEQQREPINEERWKSCSSISAVSAGQSPVRISTPTMQQRHR
jgi:hypothetical protein